MLPEKNLQELTYREKRGRAFTIIAAGVLFLVSLLFLGPLTHEAMHAAWLEFLGCFYSTDAGFSAISGFYASIQPVCSMSVPELLAFYSIGYAATISTGGLLNLVGTRSDSKKVSLILTATGTGMLLSVLLSVTVKGDIQSITSLLALPGFYTDLAILFIVLGVFVSSLKPLERLFDELERQDR